MARTSNEILAEISEHEQSLKGILSQEGLIILIDLQYYADKMKDLKQELRIAQARENQ